MYELLTRGLDSGRDVKGLRIEHVYDLRTRLSNSPFWLLMSETVGARREPRF